MWEGAREKEETEKSHQGRLKVRQRLEDRHVTKLIGIGHQPGASQPVRSLDACKAGRSKGGRVFSQHP